MNAYETSATVAEHGELQLGGLPFAPGTRVEVSISPKEAPTTSKQAAFDELDQVYQECRDLHGETHGAEAVKPETFRHARRLIERFLPSIRCRPVEQSPMGTSRWSGIARQTGCCR